MDSDFPFSWEWKIIPTDEVKCFRGVGLNHQPDNVKLGFIKIQFSPVDSWWIPSALIQQVGSNHQPDTMLVYYTSSLGLLPSGKLT